MVFVCLRSPSQLDHWVCILYAWWWVMFVVKSRKWPISTQIAVRMSLVFWVRCNSWSSLRLGTCIPLCEVPLFSLPCTYPREKYTVCLFAFRCGSCSLISSQFVLFPFLLLSFLLYFSNWIFNYLQWGPSLALLFEAVPPPVRSVRPATLSMTWSNIYSFLFLLFWLCYLVHVLALQYAVRGDSYAAPHSPLSSLIVTMSLTPIPLLLFVTFFF